MEGRGREGRIHAAIQTNLKGGQEGKFGRTGARHLKMGRASGRAGRGGAARSARLGKGDHLGWSCGQAGAGPGLISGPCRFGPCSPCPNLEPVALFKLSGVALGHGVGSSPLSPRELATRLRIRPSETSHRTLACCHRAISSIFDHLSLPTQHKFVLRYHLTLARCNLSFG